MQPFRQGSEHVKTPACNPHACQADTSKGENAWTLLENNKELWTGSGLTRWTNKSDTYCTFHGQAHGKHYYWHRPSGETQWQMPSQPAKEDPSLPTGWEAFWHEETGKYYYWYGTQDALDVCFGLD